MTFIYVVSLSFIGLVPKNASKPPIRARTMQTATKVPPVIAPTIAQIITAILGFFVFAPIDIAPNIMVMNEASNPSKAKVPI